MNPNLCRLALRPRDVLEVFDLGVRLVRERYAPFARLLAVTLVPILTALAALCWWFEGAPWLLLVPFALAAPLQAPFTVMTGRLLFSDDVSLRAVGRDVFERSPSLVAGWAFGLVGWGIASLTCFVGAPFVQAGLLYLTETALLERVGAQRGLQRSLRLASAHFPQAMAGAMAWWGLTLWMATLGELGGQSIFGFVLQLGQPFGAASDGRVTPYLLGGILLAQPIHAIYRLLLYVDVRTRVEGWDLQVALRALGLGR